MIDREKAFCLDEWYPDIVKIVHKQFKIASHDRDDAIQEICLALLKKQNSKASAYDPERSAPSHYIIMVARGVLINRFNRGKKFQDERSLDQMIEDVPRTLYRSEQAQINPQRFFQMSHQLNQFETWLSENDPELMPYYEMLKEGYSYNQICKKHKVPSYTIRDRIKKAIKDFQMVIFPLSELKVGGEKTRVKMVSLEERSDTHFGRRFILLT